MKPCHTTTARRIRLRALSWILARRPNCTVTLYLTLIEHTPQAVDRRFSQGRAA
jgi:hypothetical protein